MSLSYDVPEVLSRIPEIGLIYRISLEEAERFLAGLERLEREIHTDTAEGEGLTHKEKMYKLQRRETDTEAERRKRIEIHEKILGYYTFSAISALIKELAGEETTVQRTAGEEGYSALLAMLPIVSEKSRDDIIGQIKRIIPVTMKFTAEVLFNSFSFFEEKTWTEMNTMTFNEAKRYREET